MARTKPWELSEALSQRAEPILPPAKPRPKNGSALWQTTNAVRRTKKSSSANRSAQVTGRGKASQVPSLPPDSVR